MGEIVKTEKTVNLSTPPAAARQGQAPAPHAAPAAVTVEAPWYKDAIFYEARVRSFYDSDGDGIGDGRGVTEKLEYLQDLGVTALWLLPFYPSPLRDDGYDISNYTDVDPNVGTLHDFKLFLREAHRRGLRVVTELVLNHTSDQHPWFQRARRAPPGSRYRDFYVWSDTEERYRGTRIIFQDFERSNWTWDPEAKAYYWHRFYAYQPDLNFDSPDVHKAVLKIIDFWLGLGVDGMRLDAIPYLYEREGTNCENLPETHAFLRQLRSYVDTRYPHRMLLAEANQWPEDAVQYFGAGDECHMSFHFPIMPRLFMSLHQEDRFPIIDILDQTPDIPAICQWALFLRNHDELTLEMVTDEERDYMYRVYALDQQARINLGIRRRLAPLLHSDRRRIELMNALLFSLPGTPIIYYGDEIGMGDNFYLGDRNGVRTPMQWSPDRNAGFSRANPQQLFLPIVSDPEYSYEAINVEAHRNNPHSLLWFMKRLIALRKQHTAFGRGAIEFLSPSNRRVFAFIRRDGTDRVLVVANLSRFVQYVELDLAAYKGWSAVELFGRTEFPPIGDLPYLLTLGPHAFYWFALEDHQQKRRKVAVPATADLASAPPLTVRGSWEGVLRGDARTALERRLPQYLQGCRWFGGKALTMRSVRIVEQVPFNEGGEPLAVLTFLQVDYVDSSTETYVLPLAFAPGPAVQPLQQAGPQAIVAPLRVQARQGVIEGVLCDGMEDPRVSQALLQLIARRRTLRGGGGEVIASATKAWRHLSEPRDALQPPTVLRGQQSNTSVAFGQRLILKLYRRLQAGTNPDLEIGRFLTEHPFAHVAPVAGALEYRPKKGEPATLGILQGYVANQGDAWSLALDEIKRFLDHAITRSADIALPTETVLQQALGKPPELARELLGAQLETARTLGLRTGELHLALASSTDNPSFSPEPMTTLAARAMYQSMRNLKSKVFRLARERMKLLPEPVAEAVRHILTLEPRILKTFHAILERKIVATRIRCHGDFHLGQVLHTGKDFVIIDFEGEPARSLTERRRKRPALQDVAGMLRSFHYAAYTVLATGTVPGADAQIIERWLRFWYAWMSSAYVKAYLECVGTASFVPQVAADCDAMLQVFLLEKCVYELGYELNNRPDWVHIPVHGIVELVEGA
jgi:maltose alpha-D-glucosyltransferase / alpha-amylase